ncbi:hypothetical protein QFZ48_003329 [Chitinophaga sp. W2I13]
MHLPAYRGVQGLIAYGNVLTGLSKAVCCYVFSLHEMLFLITSVFYRLRSIKRSNVALPERSRAELYLVLSCFKLFLIFFEIYRRSHQSGVPPVSGPFNVATARATALGLVTSSICGMGRRRINFSVEMVPPLLLITTGNNLG